MEKWRRLTMASVTISEVIEELKEELPGDLRREDALRECRMAFNALSSAIVILCPKEQRIKPPYTDRGVTPHNQERKTDEEP